MFNFFISLLAFDSLTTLTIGVLVSRRMCLSVRIHISETTCSRFAKFYLRVTYGRGSVFLSLTVCVILCLAVLIQYRSVTDRQTDRHTTTAYTALSIASRGKTTRENL